MESWLFLALILVVALVGKNMSLIIATGVVMLFKLLPFTSKWLPTIQAKGINWGVTVISVAILIPIATGQIGFKDLIKTFKTPAGWIVVLAGIAVLFYLDMVLINWPPYHKLLLPWCLVRLSA